MIATPGFLILMGSDKQSRYTQRTLARSASEGKRESCVLPRLRFGLVSWHEQLGIEQLPNLFVKTHQNEGNAADRLAKPARRVKGRFVEPKCSRRIEHTRRPPRGVRDGELSVSHPQRAEVGDLAVVAAAEQSVKVRVDREAHGPGGAVAKDH